MKLPTTLYLAASFSALFFGLGLNWQSTKPVVKEYLTTPTRVELQAMVGCEKIDGIIGPETVRLWKLAENQQYADKWNYYYKEK